MTDDQPELDDQLQIIETSYAIWIEAGPYELSYWDKLNKQAVSGYGHEMAERVRLMLDERGNESRLRGLMLGEGGGTIAGDVLCNHRGEQVTELVIVELVGSIRKLARERFFPVMFSNGCEARQLAVHVIAGDAVNVSQSLAANISAGIVAPFDFIIEDFPPAFDDADAMPAAFWGDLRRLSASNAILLANTIFGDREQFYEGQQSALAEFGALLRDAGWSDIVYDRQELSSNVVVVATAR